MVFREDWSKCWHTTLRFQWCYYAALSLSLWLLPSCSDVVVIALAVILSWFNIAWPERPFFVTVSLHLLISLTGHVLAVVLYSADTSLTAADICRSSVISTASLFLLFLLILLLLFLVFCCSQQVNDSHHWTGGSRRRRTAATVARHLRSSHRWEIGNHV